MKNQSLGKLANDNGQSLHQVVQTVLESAVSVAGSTFNARRSTMAKWIDVEAYSPGTDLAGPVDLPAPIPTPEGNAAPAVQFVADLAAGALVEYSAVWTVSLQRASTRTERSIRQSFAAIGNHFADGIEEAVVDSLTALSLPAGQTDTTLKACLGKFAALRTPNGGYAPGAKVLLAAESLRSQAADENWNNLGLELIFSRILPTSVLYILPAPDSETIFMPILEGVLSKVRNSPDPVPAWMVNLGAFAASAPQIRDEFIVRGTIA